MAELNTAFQAASAEMYAQSGAQGGAQAGPDMNAGQQGGAQDNTKHGDNVQGACRRVPSTDFRFGKS